MPYKSRVKRIVIITDNYCSWQVGAAAVGTIAGNALSGLAGNYLNGCRNRGKRSLLMHGLTKRQALEVAEKQTGSTDPVST